MGYYSCLEISRGFYSTTCLGDISLYVEICVAIFNGWLLFLSAFNYPPIENYFGFSIFFNSFKHSNMCCDFPSEQYSMYYFPSISLINEQFFCPHDLRDTKSSWNTTQEILLSPFNFHFLGYWESSPNVFKMKRVPWNLAKKKILNALD